jgi:hypothetical protein
MLMNPREQLNYMGMLFHIIGGLILRINGFGHDFSLY